jgi:DNA-binding protein|tara:strand:+ start:3550 stop:4152 length:603 start_codon:yes stop_codon:yes gene_type:complete
MADDKKENKKEEKQEDKVVNKTENKEENKTEKKTADETKATVEKKAEDKVAPVQQQQVATNKPKRNKIRDPNTIYVGKNRFLDDLNQLIKKSKDKGHNKDRLLKQAKMRFFTEKVNLIMTRFNMFNAEEVKIMSMGKYMELAVDISQLVVNTTLTGIVEVGNVSVGTHTFDKDKSGKSYRGTGIKTSTIEIVLRKVKHNA